MVHGFDWFKEETITSKMRVQSLEIVEIIYKGYGKNMILYRISPHHISKRIMKVLKLFSWILERIVKSI